ncbi:conserved hypothetical protein [Trichinella spiralis]|uniref:hypothetical protein n=1 Tax=Trichinella spiralis TaxID=6334 RepID=UPI0001EFEE55|nr:conserved hypothetical protein [Trichinella spiralis]
MVVYLLIVYARRFQHLKSSSSNRAVFNANHGNMLPIEETESVQLSEIFRCNWRIWFSIFRLLRVEDIMRLSYASREINAMAQSYFRTLKTIDFSEFIPLQLKFSSESRDMFCWMIKNCVEITELKTIITASHLVTPLDFRAISRFRHLTFLDFSGCFISSEELSSVFSQLSNLKHLNMSYIHPFGSEAATGQFEEGLKSALEQLRNLERNSYVSGMCLANMDCTAMKKLSIYLSSLNLRVVEGFISRCGRLCELNLLSTDHEPISATSLIPMLQLTNPVFLTRLSICYRSIRYLHTSASELWATIRRFVNLNSLEILCGYFVRIMLVDQIRLNFPNLQRLKLETSAIDSLLVLFLIKESNLEDLCLVNTQQCRHILNDLVLNGAVCASIRRLELHNFFWHPTMSRCVNCTFPNLELLSICGRRWSNECLLSMNIEFLSKLKTLHVGAMDSEIVSSTAINRLFFHCQNVENLALTALPMTDMMARTLMERCTKLKEVIIHHENQLSPTVLTALHRKFLVKYCG